MKANIRLWQRLLVAVTLGGAIALALPNPLPAAPAAASSTAKEAKKHTIKGIVLNRPNGGFLGLTLENHHFVLHFYNSKKEPVKVDVARATARWPVRYLPHDEFTVLNPNDDGTALTSPKYVRPPYAFNLYLFLFDHGSDKSVEHYVINFHGMPKDKAGGDQ